MNRAEVDQLDGDLLDGVTDSRTDCNCLPACSGVTYDVDASNSAIHWGGVFEAYNSSYDEGYVAINSMHRESQQRWILFLIQ